MAEFLSLRKSAGLEPGPVGKESDPETWDESILVDAIETLKPDTCLLALGCRKWPVYLPATLLQDGTNTHLSHHLPAPLLAPHYPAREDPWGVDQGARW